MGPTRAEVARRTSRNRIEPDSRRKDGERRSPSAVARRSTRTVTSLSSLTHYTEEPSALSASPGRAFTRVRGGGFVTREMLEETLDDLRRSAERWDGDAVLVDLSEVAGYESACMRPAKQFLLDAASLGLTRIALVASSSVMRRATQLAASTVAVEIRTFEYEPHAARWLAGQPPV